MSRTMTPLMLLASATGADAQPAIIAPGAGFEVERYDVALLPDLATTAVAGTETIAVRATSGGITSLAFSGNGLRISEATSGATPIRVSAGTDAIVFTLPRALREGERAALRFRLEGRPARGVTAVPGGMYTGYYACDWMVCLQDAPGDKSQLTLDLTLPAGAESVGVGRRGPDTVLPGGLVRHRWRTTRPYSPYLFAFGAGRFARSSARTAQGELVYLDATGAGPGDAGLSAQSPAIAAFLADKAGMPFPDRRYIQLLAPGREAQESASFSLIGREELELERDDPSSGWIVAHEMAHQWWGNLVTCATWQDFWLNEGIATFMVAAWKEHRYGQTAYSQELDAARRRLAAARAIGFDKPLAWDGRYPSLRARRAVQYSKGALFLAHLRETVGDAAFWKGIRAFTRRHAGGTVTSRDFQLAMQEATRRDLSPMFDDWVYGDGSRPGVGAEAPHPNHR